MNYVTAGEACKYFQISYVTLKRWREQNKLKCKVFGTKKILYDIDSLNSESIDTRQNVIYARVSTTNQKTDLNNQINLIKSYMLANGISPDAVYSEIASGINDNRPELNKLLHDIFDKKIKTVYITYKDRLTRFGFNYFKNIFAMNGVELIVLDNLENTEKTYQDELTEDLISVIHHYSTKLYSNRRKRMKEIQKLLEEESHK